MRLPRISLPDISGNRMPLLYGGFTFIAFLVCLVVTFPYDVLIRGALSRAGGVQGVDFDSAGFAWHRGIVVSGLRVKPPGAEVPQVQLDQVYLRPSLSQWLSLNPYGVDAQAELYGGMANGTFDLADGKLAGALVVEGLSLGRYAPLSSLLEDGSIGGRIDAQLSFETSLAAPNAGQAAGVVRLSRAALLSAKIAGFGVPDIHMDDAKLDFSLKGGRLEVKELSANGKEIVLKADGQVVLRDPLPNSALNLQAVIQPGPEAPDPIRGLLSLIPRPAGAKADAPVHISGTIARPRVR